MKLLVIGDTIIDHDVFGDVVGTSLETPTIKVKFKAERYYLGGAASVVRHLVNLGADVTFITANATKHQQLFSSLGAMLVNLDDQFACIKSRFWVQKSDEKYKYLQMNNENELNQQAVGEYYTSVLKRMVEKENFDKIIVTDYRLGIVTDELADILKTLNTFTIGACQQSDRSNGLNRLIGFDLLVCNETEAKCLLVSEQRLCVTKGNAVCWVDGQDYATRSISVKDTIGAGDAFLAAFAFSGDPNFSNEFAREFLIRKNDE